MKLIDILVRELPSQGGWPDGVDEIEMHDDGEIFFDGDRPDDDIKLSQCSDGWQRGMRSKYSNAVPFEQYEAALAESKVPVWDGEGLPPIGIKCEHCPGGTTQHEWEVVTVLAINERTGGAFTDYWLMKEDGSSYIVGNPYRFRPIRTEAERKREHAVEALSQVVEYRKGCNDKAMAGWLYNEIAAGKIPGIRLTDDATG